MIMFGWICAAALLIFALVVQERFLVWLCAKIGIIDGVLLIDFDGKRYQSFVRHGGYAKYSIWTPFGRVRLRDDGTCEDCGFGSFLKKWERN